MRSPSAWLVILVAAAAAAAVPSASAGVNEAEDFQLNSFTTGDQGAPAVAVGADGGYLVVWESAASAGSDADGSSVQVRFLPLVGQAGLAGWWRGDGDGTDSSGEDNDAAFEGAPAFVSGVVGLGLRLDGVDDALAVPDSVSLDLGDGDFSVTLWVKTGAQFPYLVDKMAVAPRTGFSTYLKDGNPGIILYSGEVGRQFNSTTFVADEDAHLVAITVERTSTTGGRIWVDGELSTIFDPTLASGPLANDAPLVIGRRGDALGGGGYLGGVVDDVRLCGRALGEAEVRYLAAARGGALFSDGLERGDTLSWSTVSAR